MDDFIDACSQGDRERIQSFYSPDVVVFDCPPELRTRGIDNYMKVWDRWFLTQFEFPVSYDRREEEVLVNGNMGVVYGLMHIQGKFKESGEQMSSWLRHTLILSKTSGKWMIVHEHNSVPIAEDGTALMDLSPDQK